jgi:hypothetical protein
MHLIAALRPRLGRTFARLRRDTGGLALIEFALSMPIVLGIGGYGVELSNVALANLRVSQYALELADSASRIGVDSGLQTYQLREADINDVLQGVRLDGQSIGLTTYGRVTLSSLEGQSDGTQLLHWQRCIGLESGAGYESHYDTPGSGTGGKVVAGMGDSANQITAPPGSAVMFVEINYQYQPLFGELFVKPRIIHYTASFIVRDHRDYSQVYNPAPAATPASCSNHTA